MYVWTDRAGVMNISNLPPPDGARMVSVTRAVPRDAAQEAALREAARQAEMRALSERVQQLEAEVQEARRDPPAPVVAQPAYAPAAPAPYIVVVSQPPAPAPTYPQPVAGCDDAWGNCGLGFWPGLYHGYYPTSVVVVRDRHWRHAQHLGTHRPQPRHPGGRTIAPPARTARDWRR
jgi:hypothetical protein